jgi:hypothetical protein
MAKFILMLTKDDRTVPNALDVYDEVRDTGFTYVGFKDVGLPVEDLRLLATRIRSDGRKVMLEVVSTEQEAELRSVRSAIEIGVDYLLGGRHAQQALPLLADSRIRYFPFCGTTVGHPTRLTGTVDSIVEDARRLAALRGVAGLDLLSYRYDAGDPEELTRRVVAAVGIPVIAAGSIDRPERIAAMSDAGVWGFTVGSALFEGRFAKHLLRQQIQSLIEIEGVA